MGAFRKAGFWVEPWLVDYRTRGGADLLRPFDKVSEGLRRVDVAMREWVGLIAYWFTDRTDALFPAPNEGAPDCAAPSGAEPGSPPASPCRPNL